MKFLFTLFILFAIPLILCAFLLMVIVPLLVQHFYTPKHLEDNIVYPYLTLWEAV